MKQRLQFVENSISVLDGESHLLMTALFFENVPAARVAVKLNCVRSTVYYRSEQIIKSIAEVYGLQFGHESL